MLYAKMSVYVVKKYEQPKLCVLVVIGPMHGITARITKLRSKTHKIAPCGAHVIICHGVAGVVLFAGHCGGMYSSHRRQSAHQCIPQYTG